MNSALCYNHQLFILKSYYLGYEYSLIVLFYPVSMNVQILEINQLFIASSR